MYTIKRLVFRKQRLDAWDLYATVLCTRVGKLSSQRFRRLHSLWEPCLKIMRLLVCARQFSIRAHQKIHEPVKMVAHRSRENLLKASRDAESEHLHPNRRALERICATLRAALRATTTSLTVIRNIRRLQRPVCF